MDPTKHIAHEGTYSDALEFFKGSGGMLFAPKSEEHHTTVLVGRAIHSFYPPDSQPRKDAQRLAYDWNLPDCMREHATAGRLAKWYIDNYLRLPYHRTYFSKDYQKLARDGYHWHYLYARPGKYQYAFEWDLKSAYATAWSQRPSMLYHPSYGWLEDGGAAQRLGQDLPYLPKWFRLALLGVVASHKMDFYTKDKGSMTFKLKRKTQPKISYGAAFNAAHIAIWKVWHVMRQAHEILGSHVKRVHTDGMVVSFDCMPEGLDYEVVELVEKYGFTFSIKASGPAYIKDVTSGIVGEKTFGNKKEIVRAAYADGHDFNLCPVSHVGLGQFGRKAAKIAGLVKPDDSLLIAAER